MEIREPQACGQLEDNQETAGYMGRCAKHGAGPSAGCSVNVKDVPLLPSDVKRRWDTCAVVGSAQSENPAAPPAGLPAIHEADDVLARRTHSPQN